jgi:hypothetical protein
VEASQPYNQVSVGQVRASQHREGDEVSTDTDALVPVAEVRCWEEPRYYEKPPRKMFELIQLDGFRALPPGAHLLYGPDTIERLTSAREVQDAALECLRADLRECANMRDAEIERLTRERGEAVALLEDWVGSFADTIEGGEADPLVIATRDAIRTTKATT